MGGSEATLGAQRPGGPADSGGGARLSLKKVGGKNTRGKPLDPGFMARSLSLARFGDRCLWYDSGAVSSGMPRPIWDAFSRENMLESMFVKEGFQIGLISPKAFPLGVEQSGGLFGQVQAKPP